MSRFQSVQSCSVHLAFHFSDKIIQVHCTCQMRAPIAKKLERLACPTIHFTKKVTLTALSLYFPIRSPLLASRKLIDKTSSNHASKIGNCSIHFSLLGLAAPSVV
ncbi:unnamed protein product [Albugo candida]|uniref:Uncharacterized protein n=1 Tax=Albugo candida TaxID=65357 RepID=A0A024FWZ8_9STRA|nr:unnamed protein product [Albugo candida]|eukprot:CCI11189.1 unnamed protein product [Albugo candida]